MDMTKDIIDFKQTLEPRDDDSASNEAVALLNMQQTPSSPPTPTPTGSEPVNSKQATPEVPAKAPAQTTLYGSAASTTDAPNVTIADVVSPPPRPLTSSELVGLTSAHSDPDLHVDMSLQKSRSLPASPNHHLSGVASAELPHMAALFEFGQHNMATEVAEQPMKRRSALASLMAKPPRSKCNKPAGPATGVGAAGAAASNQQFCLRWNNYQSNLTNVFDELLQNESFVDVTLACEGQSIKAHKMVLSACSPYFQTLFYDNPCQHPIVIMRDVRWQELKAIMEFMYKGEINVSQDQINPLLKVAEMLKIRGLAEVNSGSSHGNGGVAAHPMAPEQRMTVYEDDEDDEEADEENEDGCQKSKRARLLDDTLDKLAPAAVAALDLNLSAQRQRKRSRDGNLLDAEHLPPRYSGRRSRSPTPEAATRHAAEPNAMSTQPPIAMTTSTIVRNPFASPNPSAQSSAGAPTNASSAAAASSGSAAPHDTAASTPTSAIYRPAASCSPTLPLTHSHIGAEQTSPTGRGAHQLAAYSHPATAAAAAAAAAALASNPHHSHHAHAHHPHHQHAAAAAQQLAAQHQLHAAAHSHVAMASALGASLAAAAAGAGTSAGSTGAGAPSATGSGSIHHDELEIKPEIAEMIREEERAKMIEGGHPWMGGASTSSVADSYQYQLQSMWQKCWNTNQQNLVQQLRFRERGPLKSWRPEAMAEAIFSVLKEGLSLSQAARKFDIPYPTFVLYANRVHNMLGPSLDGGTDPRPKARGRPQRILLGMWPEELIRSVIKAVVFRDYREIKEDMSHTYANGQAHAQSPFGVAGNAVSANGYHNAAKLAAQNAALAPPDSPSPLSTMTETLRRQIMSQQQKSPISQTMNMYKSPAYLQRSEIEDQVSAAAAAVAKQQAERRGTENLADLSTLGGLMGLPGLNVMPAQAPRGASQMHQSAAAYARERERERERERDRERDRERERERERELKEAMQSRQYGNQSHGSAAGSSAQKQSSSGVGGGVSVGAPTGARSPYLHYKGKEPPNYAYNKRFLESLPPGVDLGGIAYGLLQKSVNKSPSFEDFFPGQDMSELFANAENTPAASYPPQVRESPLMKIKLEHQPAEVQHED